MMVECAGERLQLLGERAVYWPAGKTLVLADPHFGKAAAFRRAGIPVPRTTAADVARLEGLLERTGARRLVVLGDFLHARGGRSAETMRALGRWRERWRRGEVVLVRGNHDRNAGDPPAAWGVQCVEGGWGLAGLVLVHEPETASPGALAESGKYALAGHLHPAVVLQDRDGSSLRAPCFWFGPRVAVLPAFGSFVGMHAVRPRAGDRVFVAGPGERAGESVVVRVAG